MIVKMTSIRKDALVTGEIFHIFTRSIAGFKVFSEHSGLQRFIGLMIYYNDNSLKMKFSDYIELTPTAKRLNDRSSNNQIVQIIAYCLMPTHLHFVLKQLKDRGISVYMSGILNSYTRYFNVSHSRKGPLWESKFKNVLIRNEDQLLHLTRYIHLNPTSANLVTKPEEWEYSSYCEYINEKPKTVVCDLGGILEVSPDRYRTFVNSRTAYQRSLSKIKHLLIDNYTG